MKPEAERGERPKEVDKADSRASHVCFFPGQLQLGGVGRNTINLAEEMLGRGVRVDFFLSKRAGAYLSRVPEAVRIVEGRGSVKASIRGLARYLREERPELLVSARPYINLAAVVARGLAGTETRLVLTERTTNVAEQDRRWHPGRWLMNAGCRWLYPQADHIVAVSEAVADDLVRRTGLDRQEIRVIYNPVVTRRITDLSRVDPKDPWLDASDAPIVLGAGRLTLQKDFWTLIRAFAKVRRRMKVRLVIVGEGDDRESLEALADELGVASDVHLPGYVENPFAYMGRSSVFVLSSGWEGLPTALIEALATGTPVVSTDCPGGSRVILADGEFGELVPVGDPGSMARAILASLENPPPAERLIDRAADFSAAKAADHYLGLIPP